MGINGGVDVAEARLPHDMSSRDPVDTGVEAVEFILRLDQCLVFQDFDAVANPTIPIWQMLLIREHEVSTSTTTKSGASAGFATASGESVSLE